MRRLFIYGGRVRWKGHSPPVTGVLILPLYLSLAHTLHTSLAACSAHTPCKKIESLPDTSTIPPIPHPRTLPPLFRFPHISTF